MTTHDGAPGGAHSADKLEQAGMPPNHNSFRLNWPGLILVFVVGILAFSLSLLPTALDALALAIVLGIAARILFGRAEPFLPGARVGIQIILPIGIMLYGLNLDFSQIMVLDINTIILTLLCMLLFYIFIYWLNSLLWKLKPEISELIATGSAVCGASAIAVLFPAVESEPEDISISLLVVTAAGLLGVMGYPIIKTMSAMSDTTYAIFSGATLHEPGLVSASVAYLGQDLVQYALAVKTIRILMLAPIAIVTSFIHTRRTAHSIIELRRVWFLLPFILLGLLVSLVPAARLTLEPLKPLATLIFAVALASVGFSVDIESVLNIGGRPLLVGLLGWFGVVIIFLLISPLFIT